MLVPLPASAQGRVDLSGVAPGDTVIALPERQYPAGPVHRLLLGENRRELWETPVAVEVLDLTTFAGGLTPLRRGGGLQTRSLRFQGADGRVYNFRSLDKDAARTLDPELRRSIAAQVLQDQVSSLLPLSALVVDPILEAAGVLHATPVLRVMPDDPRLGEFREEFAGMLGLLIEREDEGPDGEPGFAGSTRVTGSERMLERLEEHPRDRVDAEAFLRARLVDAFVGDWDRHPDQWRWAEFEEGDRSRWQPIPRDRDWALARMEGVLVWAAGYAFPHYKGFRDEYHHPFHTFWSGRALDRRILAELERGTYERVAADLVERLTDEVLESAVGQLPPAYREKTGDALLQALKARRDGLEAYALDFYRFLAAWVDVWATDEGEDAVIEREPGGAVRLSLYDRRDGQRRPEPYLSRRFLPDETREIRLHLRGGDDHVEVTGARNGRIRVRVVGGGGDDVYRDESGAGGLHLYDARGDNDRSGASSVPWDARPYEAPHDPSSATHQALARDWGSHTIPVPHLSFDPDLGLFAGLGFIRWGYGFRHFPHRIRIEGAALFGTGSGRPRVSGSVSFPLVRGLRGRVRARWSAAEVRRFYGFGNGSAADSVSDFFRAERREGALEAMVSVEPTPGLDLAVGPTLRTFDLGDNTGRLIAAEQPYGSGAFTEAGLIGELDWDRRDRARAATRGAHLHLAGRWFPAALDVEDPFGGLRGTLSAYFGSTEAPGRPVVSLRVGGEKLWGRTPYQEAAYLGGGGDLRGFRNQRFAGDASVFGNAELRLAVADYFLLLPTTFGVFGLADAGRVFSDLDEPDDLHTAVGGGVWFAFVGDANVVSIAAARSDEEAVALYVKVGFHH